MATFDMSPNRRIFLNIVATYGQSLYALVCGLFISWWVLAAVEQSEIGSYGMVGGMAAIVILADAMRPDRGGIAVDLLKKGELRSCVLTGTATNWGTRL